MQDTERMTQVIERVAKAGYDKFTATVITQFTVTDAIVVSEGIIAIDPWDETVEEQKQVWRDLSRVMITEYLQFIHE